MGLFAGYNWAHRQTADSPMDALETDGAYRRALCAHGGATTIGPDATLPPAICQNLRGGGLAGGWGGSWQFSRGVGLRAIHYYHMHTSRVCVCPGAWGYRGMYAIIAISRLCREESLRGL